MQVSVGDLKDFLWGVDEPQELSQIAMSFLRVFEYLYLPCNNFIRFYEETYHSLSLSSLNKQWFHVLSNILEQTQDPHLLLRNHTGFSVRKHNEVKVTCDNI